MIFKRRDNRLTLARLKDFLIPKKGWRRAIDYIIFRLKRLPDTPHKIAIGLAIGVFCSFTPFFGLHIFLAALLAYLFNGNIGAALLGTFFGNPITWPFIAASSVKLGQVILGYSVTDFETSIEQILLSANALFKSFTSIFGDGESEWSLVSDMFIEIFFPYFIGGLILGLATAVLSYFFFRPIIYAYKVATYKKKLKENRRNINSLKGRPR